MSRHQFIVTQLDDWLEGEAYEWVLSAILNIYKLETENYGTVDRCS